MFSRQGWVLAVIGVLAGVLLGLVGNSLHRILIHHLPVLLVICAVFVLSPGTTVRRWLKAYQRTDRSSRWFPTIVQLSTVLVAVFVFWLQVRYTRTYINTDAINIIIHPLLQLLDAGVSGVINLPQMNWYTGNPFFLLPGFLLLGFTPDALRVLIIGFMAATAALSFLSYYEIFDFRKAVIGVLLLVSMDRFILFRHPDYVYTTFFFALLFYLFVRWLQRLESGGGRGHLYAISFFGGLFLYFKAAVVYLLLGFAAATVYRRGVTAVRQIDLLPVLVLFLVGAAPFLLHIQAADVDIGMPRIAGSDDHSVVESVQIRAGQLVELITPTTDPLAAARFSLGDTTIHLYTALLALSIVLLLTLRRHGHVVILFLTVFLLLNILPRSSTLTTGNRPHVIFIVPLVPLLVIGLTEVFTERFRYKTRYTVVFSAAAIVLLLNIAAVAADGPSDRVVAVDDPPLKYWAGDQDTYNQIRRLDLGHAAATNSYRGYISLLYLLDVEEYALLPSTAARQGSVFYPYEEGVNVPVRDLYPVDSFSPDEQTTLLIRVNRSCVPAREFCGATVEEIREELSLDMERGKRVTIAGEPYLFFDGNGAWGLP